MGAGAEGAAYALEDLPDGGVAGGALERHCGESLGDGSEGDLQGREGLLLGFVGKVDGYDLRLHGVEGLGLAPGEVGTPHCVVGTTGVEADGRLSEALGLGDEVAGEVEMGGLRQGQGGVVIRGVLLTADKWELSAARGTTGGRGLDYLGGWEGTPGAAPPDPQGGNSGR